MELGLEIDYISVDHRDQVYYQTESRNQTVEEEIPLGVSRERVYLAEFFEPQTEDLHQNDDELEPRSTCHSEPDGSAVSPIPANSALAQTT